MSTVAVTGANGFIGKNITFRLIEAGHSVVPLGHAMERQDLTACLRDVDSVIHLAGVNRPTATHEFESGNAGMSHRLAGAMRDMGRPIPLVYSSSIQAELDNPYGHSKRAAEEILRGYGDATGAPVHIWRLPNVFGKWCRPNYNSVVATFCHNIANGMAITVNDPDARLKLVYVDDVAEAMLSTIAQPGKQAATFGPIYDMTVGDLASTIMEFRDSRQTLVTGAVGSGLRRALHATYLSYLSPKSFAYDLVSHTDPRGMFAEMLRTPNAGQFSFFTAHPGITRGGHYHHSKTEKFLVVHGNARFGFRNVLTNETYVIETTATTPQVVETVPGWSHDITNIGVDTMVVMLWANEIFDRDRPDTIPAKVLPK